MLGFGGDAIFVDEVNAIPWRVFTEAVLPMLNVGPLFLGISSLGVGTMRNLDTLCEARWKNAPVMTRYAIVFVCLLCDLAGEADRCTHFVPPPWQTAGSHGKTAALYGTGEGRNIYLSDSRGVVTEQSTQAAFNSHDVADAFAPQRAIATDDINFDTVFVAFDMFAGGQGSDMAVVSTARTHDCARIVLLGADTYTGVRRTELEVQLILKHIEALRDASEDRVRHVWLAPESNMVNADTVATQVYSYFHSMRAHRSGGLQCSFLTEGEGVHERKGFHTNAASKSFMVQMMQTMLLTHSVACWKNFACGGALVSVPAELQQSVEFIHRPQHAMDKLREQMLQFERRVAVQPTRAGTDRRITVTYSGKHNGKDDMVMAMLIAVCRAPPRHVQMNAPPIIAGTVAPAPLRAMVNRSYVQQ
jgi:hypothetical protein